FSSKTTVVSNTPIRALYFFQKKTLHIDFHKKGAWRPLSVHICPTDLTDRYTFEFGNGQPFGDGIQVLSNRLGVVLDEDLVQQSAVLVKLLQFSLGDLVDHVSGFSFRNDLGPGNFKLLVDD